MKPEEINMHLATGRYYGQESTCGSKFQHVSEEAAVKAAKNLNNSGKARHEVEAYPCYWCSDPIPGTNPVEFAHLNWHIGRSMTVQERDILTPALAESILEMEEIQIQVAEPLYGIQIGEKSLRVHNRKLCEGRNCSVHNPSDHHMKDWPLNWRGDRRIMERICPHGVGHPDPDDAEFRSSRDGEEADTGVHGCDGCCYEEGMNEETSTDN